MTYLKKNKLIIFFFILGILQLLYYWSERSNFKLQILSNPFKKNSYLSYILPERIIETRKILISNDINKFNLSTKLRNEMFKLYMVGTPDTFLEDLDRLKEKNGINNLWKEEQYKEWREEVKKHPEKVGKLHITEDSFTFEFNDKNNKN